MFKEWVSDSGYLSESQKISQYLKEKDHMEERQFVAELPVVTHWLDKIAQQHPVPLKPGKTALWLRGKHYFPVKIADVQDLTVALERTDGKDWSELHHLWPVFNDPESKKQLIIPKTKAILVDDKEYFRFLNWLTYLYVTKQPEDPNTFFSTLLQQHKNVLEKVFANKGSEFTTTDFDINSLKDVAGTEEKRQIKAARSNKPGGSGSIVLEFPNGWKWVSLDKGHCEIEGNAAGHCGNANPLPGENLLSLRDQDNHIHMTVVVKDGVTSEMKAPGNRKPKEYTHPYVIALLKHMNLRVGHGKWMQENDFKITDLHPEMAYKLHKERPDLIKGYSTIQFLALEAKHNQDRFKELMKQTYGVDFPYPYDYADQAILLTQGPLDDVASRYHITNSKGEVLSTQNTQVDKEGVDINDLFEIIANGWDNIRNDVKNAIKQAYNITPQPNSTEGNTVANALRMQYRKDANTRAVLKNLYDEMRREMHIDYNNTNLRNNAQEQGGGIYIKLLPGKTLQLQILMHPQDAERVLDEKQPIEIPQDMQFDVYQPGNYDGDEEIQHKWELALTHALDKTRFWERPMVTQQGQGWQQALDAVPGLRDREKAYQQQQRQRTTEHPMQKQVRMEYIRRELDQRMMNGGYQEFVQELKAKGWWEEYKRWLQEQGLSLGYGF